MNDYRVIVTGSRDWTDRATLVSALEEAHTAALRANRRLVVIHGDCPKGADRMAHYWVAAMRADGYVVAEERHPADWETGGKGAGFDRNQRMVDEGADLTLAFPMPCSKPTCPREEAHLSHGTSDCVRRAIRAGIETRQHPARPVVAR